MDRKKELKMQYKQMKHPMGIFTVRFKDANKYYIEATQNLTGAINAAKFKLGAGAHPCRELQKDWKTHSETNFIIEILENLEYDKDESKTDYSEDLALLKLIWEERLNQDHWKQYDK